MQHAHRPLALIILDGWGYSENPEHNAIMAANTPFWDKLWQQQPHTLIHASGEGVGLPGTQMGNSEVGHLNIGAGRVVYQELTRISKAIADGSFADNAELCRAVDTAVTNHKAVHIMGLLSPGGVHSLDSHIEAMVQMAAKRGAEKIYVHVFTDGRDTPPQSALESIERLENILKESGKGRIASVIGRFYAMDRDKRWQRVAKAYDLITRGEAEFHAGTCAEAVDAAYARGETDEFIQATVIGEPVGVEAGDALIMMNFRADRMREITQALTDPAFSDYDRGVFKQPGAVVTLTEYKKEFGLPVAFPPEKLDNLLGECLSRHGLSQLRIAETEKYAHVTFFFNGGTDTPSVGEERELIPSPQVETYDLQPEMHADAVADGVVNAINNGTSDVIICNFANADMVGHSGSFDATVKAVEVLDGCLQKIWEALQAAGGEMLVTADHGNAEQLYDNDKQQRHTAHTSNPVPFVFASDRPAHCAESGQLADIAPTMLSLLEIPIPDEMSHHLLVELD